MESKRQKQVTELVRRNFGILLQQEGGLIYGHDVLVTVTSAKMSPDMSIAKIYLSVYNTENKQAVILSMESEQSHLKQMLGTRIRRHIRRIPELAFYEDDTLDEMYRLNSLFTKLKKENQMGTEEE